jgi:hypothetical protein
MVVNRHNGHFTFLNMYRKTVFRIRYPVLFNPPDPESGMEQWSDPGSGIKHPGSATLIEKKLVNQPFETALVILVCLFFVLFRRWFEARAE